MQDYMMRAMERRAAWLNERIPSVPDLPEGESDGWSLKRFEIEDDVRMRLANMRMAMKGVGDRMVIPGTYTRLFRGDTLVMSDTPAEKSDHVSFVIQSRGRVLIGGLGMGMVLNAVARREVVEHVTVIELEDGPINLVWDFYKERYGDKIDLIQADVREWKSPGQRWDCVWMDIWDDICADDWDEHKLLKRRYAQKADYVDTWVHDLVQDLHRRGY